MADINMGLNEKWRNIFSNGSDGIIEKSWTKQRAIFLTFLYSDGFDQLAT